VQYDTNHSAEATPSDHYDLGFEARAYPNFPPELQLELQHMRGVIKALHDSGRHRGRLIQCPWGRE